MQHATPLVRGYKHCIMPPEAPTPLPHARRPTGRPPPNACNSNWLGIESVRDMVAALGPLRHTLVPTNSIATSPSQMHPGGNQPFGRRGREGLGSRSAISRSGRSTGRFQGWGPPPYHRVLRYEGGGTGGPAPISGNQPGLVEYATCSSPGLKGQQTQVTLSPQGTSTSRRSVWR
jgi:hypothetical protein